MRNIDLLCNGRKPDFTFVTLRTTSWMVPLVFPSWDMERRSVSMAWWLEHPSSDSPFTATSWSLMLKRPSCERANKRHHDATCDDLFLFAYVWSGRSEPWTHKSGPPMAPSDRQRAPASLWSVLLLSFGSCFLYIYHSNYFCCACCVYLCSSGCTWQYLVTLYAAPPWIIDLMKIPRSSPVSLDLFPLRLMPSPAEPLSLSGTSKVSCSFPFSGTKTVTQDTSSFWERERRGNGGRGGERDIDEEGRKQNTTQWAWMASRSEAQKLFHLRGPIRGKFSTKSLWVKNAASLFLRGGKG